MPDWLRRDPREAPVTRAPIRQAPMVQAGERALPVVIRRLARARRMTLRLAPDGSEARISMPQWGRTGDALAFAQSRAEWLERQLAALPAASPLRPGGTVRYRGMACVLEHSASAPRAPKLDHATLRVGGPEAGLARRLRTWLEGQARVLLDEDLDEYCARAGRPAPRLALSSARRRWGSCSADGVIRINWRLVMAPDAVRRSVVAHEVAHLVHFDHSPRFHALLARLFEGDIDEANAWLRREGPGLFQPFG